MKLNDAIEFCNAKSVAEAFTPVYTVDGLKVVWDRSANGYRLPTEAEWEYACRAGTATPFNTETSISVGEANYWGHYPYQIEENYFTQENLETKPEIYREETVAVGSFAPPIAGGCTICTATSANGFGTDMTPMTLPPQRTPPALSRRLSAFIVEVHGMTLPRT